MTLNLTKDGRERKTPGRKPQIKDGIVSEQPAPPAAPALDVNSPAFQEAVTTAVAAAVEQALKGMREFGAMPNTSDNAAAMLSNLAMTLSEINSQGNHKTIVDPAIMKARAEAHERMIDLLIDAKERGLKPEYRVKDTLYLVDRIIQPFKTGPNNQPVPQRISWSGPPNLQMEPLNDIAKAIYSEFRASIGSLKDVKGIASRTISVTANGLVVHGNIHNRQVVSNDMTDADGGSANGLNDDDLIVENSDPRNKQRHVLGTIADPAMATAQNEAKWN